MAERKISGMLQSVCQKKNIFTTALKVQPTYLFASAMAQETADQQRKGKKTKKSVAEPHTKSPVL